VTLGPGWRESADWPGGIRHEDGVSKAQRTRRTLFNSARCRQRN
jgi:hypothetical protein